MEIKHLTKIVVTPVEAQTNSSGANKSEPGTDRCKAIRNLISRPMRGVCADILCGMFVNKQRLTPYFVLLVFACLTYGREWTIPRLVRNAHAVPSSLPQHNVLSFRRLAYLLVHCGSSYTINCSLSSVWLKYYQGVVEIKLSNCVAEVLWIESDPGYWKIWIWNAL